jgi:AbrB family looped-hinge helix DNA binding protein
MPKVTRKLQITLPKRMAEAVGIGPGDEVEFAVAGEGLRLAPRAAAAGELSTAERLRLFREATARQALRNAAIGAVAAESDRGWRRDELYERGPAG